MKSLAQLEPFFTQASEAKDTTQMTDLLNISLSDKLINYSEIDKLKEDKWIKYMDFCS